jgi:hypothetical protein
MTVRLGPRKRREVRRYGSPKLTAVVAGQYGDGWRRSVGARGSERMSGTTTRRRSA